MKTTRAIETDAKCDNLNHECRSHAHRSVMYDIDDAFCPYDNMPHTHGTSGETTPLVAK